MLLPTGKEATLVITGAVVPTAVVVKVKLADVEDWLVVLTEVTA